MLRHVLPVVAGATAFLCIPATASATPVPAPVENQITGWDHSAVAQDVPLADGRMATVGIGAYAGPQGTTAGWMSLQVWTPYPCADSRPGPWAPGEPVPEPVPGTCKGGLAYGSAELTDEQLDFDPLRSAVAEAKIEVPVTNWLPPSEHVPYEGDPTHPTEPTDPFEDGWWGDPDDGGWTDPGDGAITDPSDGGPTDPGGELPGYEPETTTLTVRVQLTGTGPRDTRGTHQTMCGDGMRECQSIRVYATRDALATVTVDGLAAPGAPSAAGRMYRTKSLDLAAPKFTYPA